MADTVRVGIISDVHYASDAEKARGRACEYAAIPNAGLRLLLRVFRRYIWLNDPLNKNYLLDRFLADAQKLDLLIGNGDYACDMASLGMSDDAAWQSARDCLGRLRQSFNGRFKANFGDHELGKLSFFGNGGGMRLASWERATTTLDLEPFWQLHLGRYRLMGVVSSLVALPVFEQDTLPEERPEWRSLRREHLRQIEDAFSKLTADDRVLLFCHDPTALPFLAELPQVANRLGQVDQTIIGHLHSNLILWKSRWLAGMPRIDFLGHTARRMTRALRQARSWAPFHVRLCPSLAGIELLKDGGYLMAEVDTTGRQPARFEVRKLAR